MPSLGNAIDVNRYSNVFAENDRAMFNQLPVYFGELQVKYNKVWDTWSKLLNPYKWTPNMGNVMKGVRKEKSPIIRGQFLPNVITQQPLRDIIETREVTEQVQLYRHNVDSRYFHFIPDFQDFLTNHIDFNMEDIGQKLIVLKDLFYRTAIFHGSPLVWVCGKASGTELTQVPSWTGSTITLAKNNAVLQNLVAQCTQTLTLENIKKLGTVMYNDINAEFYSADNLPEGSDGKGLKGKYCLTHGSEVWDGFTDNNPNTYLLSNKALDLDIVTGAFQGSLFGRFTCKLERFELRITADGRIVGPETTEEGPTAYNIGETVMNSDYVNAPFGVAFASGAEAYKAIKVGPPPSLFAAGSKISMDKISGMDWNGKVRLTDNLLVPGAPDGGTGATNTIYDTNKRGEYLQLISDLVMGILPVRRRNIVPIIYKRQRIATR